MYLHWSFGFLFFIKSPAGNHSGISLAAVPKTDCRLKARQRRVGISYYRAKGRGPWWGNRRSSRVPERPQRDIIANTSVRESASQIERQSRLFLYLSLLSPTVFVKETQRSFPRSRTNFWVVLEEEKVKSFGGRRRRRRILITYRPHHQRMGERHGEEMGFLLRAIKWPSPLRVVVVDVVVDQRLYPLAAPECCCTYAFDGSTHRGGGEGGNRQQDAHFNARLVCQRM